MFSASERAPVIASDRPGEVQLFLFGLVPHWAQKPMCLLNARAEGDHNPENTPDYQGAKGILQKPSFRKAIRSQPLAWYLRTPSSKGLRIEN